MSQEQLNPESQTKPELQQQEGQEPPKPEPTKPKIIVDITRGAHECELMLQHTSSDTLNPLLEDLNAALEEKGVVYGINKNLLLTLVTNPVYNRKLVIASGKKPTVGKGGSLHFLIRTDRTLRPTIKEDGTADYKDIGFIQTVEKDQPLCEIIPPEKGKDGMDVHGNVLEGIYGKEAHSPQGDGTVVSEDGSMLLAAVPGCAEVKNNIVSIKEVLKITGGVGNATGDILFNGDVFITGDVSPGFKVSGSNISIKGHIEAAILEATGNVVITEGMYGNNTGVIIAGGNIKARYLQGCTIKAGGSIYADAIIHSHLECDENVELSGKRAALIGGTSFIAKKLVLKTLGSDAHAATQVNMATTGAKTRSEIELLEFRVQSVDSEIQRVVQMLNRFDSLMKQNRLTEEHVAAIMQLKENYISLNENRKQAAEALETLKRKQLEDSMADSYIECKDKLHAGVRLTFGPLIYNVQDSYTRCRVGIVDGEISFAVM